MGTAFIVSHSPALNLTVRLSSLLIGGWLVLSLSVIANYKLGLVYSSGPWEWNPAIISGLVFLVGLYFCLRNSLYETITKIAIAIASTMLFAVVGFVVWGTVACSIGDCL